MHPEAPGVSKAISLIAMMNSAALTACILLVLAALDPIRAADVRVSSKQRWSV